MTANEPWSGHYDVAGPVWVTGAHISTFANTWTLCYFLILTKHVVFQVELDVSAFIVLAAHTTQFAQPGDSYFKHGSGVGHLDNGGSYVTFKSSDNKHMTIVIETMVT